MHNVLLLFRYAEGKEATVVVSAMLPTMYSHNIDFYVNVAIPGFNACTARFQAIERTKRLQYDVCESFELSTKCISICQGLYFIDEFLF